MKIIVENTAIQLTADQIKLIEAEREKRKKATADFISILKYFGFKSSPEYKNGFEHSYNWWAEIIDHGKFKNVWIIGEGLKDINCYPGGWVYDSPKEIEEELIKYFTKK